MNRNLSLLALCQALLFTNNVTLIAMQGLAGYALAENKSLATLPATAYIVGAALMMLPASFIMQKLGRKKGFLIGGFAGMVGAAIATLGMATQSFWVLCIGALILGVHNAFGQYYRFAAADSVPTAAKANAISLVLAGGLVGGVIGPYLSKLTRDLSTTPFTVTYSCLIGVSLLSMLVVSALQLPADALPTSDAKPARKMSEIARNPVFMVAVVCSAFGYGVMNLLMVATPLAMGFCGHAYSSAADVIMWHVIAMFAPSFFTGKVITKVGVLPVTLTGVALMGACIIFALSGQAVINFKLALVLLGLGWNFMYIGGSTLLTQTYLPSEKAKVQGTHDLLVFCVTATTSLASGVLVKLQGWEMLNKLAVVPLALAAAVMVALWMSKFYTPKLA